MDQDVVSALAGAAPGMPVGDVPTAALDFSRDPQANLAATMTHKPPEPPNPTADSVIKALKAYPGHGIVSALEAGGVQVPGWLHDADQKISGFINSPDIEDALGTVAGAKFSPWSAEEWKRVLDAYKAGKGPAELAKDFPGRTAESIRMRLKRTGEGDPQRGAQITEVWSDDRNAQFKELFKQGFSLNEIARRMKASTITLRKKAEQMGLVRGTDVDPWRPRPQPGLPQLKFMEPEFGDERSEAMWDKPPTSKDEFDTRMEIVDEAHPEFRQIPWGADEQAVRSLPYKDYQKMLEGDAVILNRVKKREP